MALGLPPQPLANMFRIERWFGGTFAVRERSAVGWPRGAFEDSKKRFGPKALVGSWGDSMRFIFSTSTILWVIGFR